MKKAVDQLALKLWEQLNEEESLVFTFLDVRYLGLSFNTTRGFLQDFEFRCLRSG